MKIWKRRISGRGGSECKGPGVVTGLACSSTCKKAGIARMKERHGDVARDGQPM